MSDRLTHECGLALVRLRKPLSWYRQEKGDTLWGLRRLFLLMEKQHNRGQDGAGIAAVKIGMAPGEPFIDRLRNAKRNAIERLFDDAFEPALDLGRRALEELDDATLKHRVPMLGEVLLGHLRYGTFGGHGSTACHPHLRRHAVASRNVALAGNFNLTNSAEIFRTLVDYGLAPVGESDTGVVLEKVGYALDREHERLRHTMGPGSLTNLEGKQLADEVGRELDISKVLARATDTFDGGYALAGLLGHGDCFICRDPNGIRPAFYLETPEVIAAASERAALCTAFDVEPAQVRAIPPGHVLAVKADGAVTLRPFAAPGRERPCSFERIYFSRGNDPDIYRERKQLGRNLAAPVLNLLGGSLDRAVFGFIPNTSETAYLGLIHELEQLAQGQRLDAVWKLVEKGTPTREALERAMNGGPRFEKVAHKDQRLRTFITHDEARRDLVSHVYDITRGTVGPQDTLVVVDDSIVRGTTLRESIITMLSRLKPARIMIVSSAPPIRYPDCYGIDMSQLGRFIAFEAAVGVVRDRGEDGILDEVERKCLEQEQLPTDRLKNHVKLIYDRVSDAELSCKVAQLVRSTTLAWKGQIDVVYQSVEGLHQAMPAHTGDWYFTGDYPTPGGLRVLNTAYLKWRRADERRAY